MLSKPHQSARQHLLTEGYCDNTHWGFFSLFLWQYYHSRLRSSLVCCIEQVYNVVRAHRVLRQLTECCQISQVCVGAHGVLSELTECCQSWRSVVLQPDVWDVWARGVWSELMQYLCTWHAFGDGWKDSVVRGAEWGQSGVRARWC